MSLSEHEKDQILDVVHHYMGHDLRRKIMVEVPQAYNAWHDRPIVSVVRVDDLRGSDVRTLDGEQVR